MKTLLLIVLLLLSFVSWAQTSLSDIPELNYGFGNSPSSRLGRSEEIVSLTKKIALENGIQTKEIRLSDRKGQSYTALQVLPSGSHSLNKEALRIDRLMSGLPLVFSPYDLSFGSNAFFDPNGSKLGIPYEFFVVGARSSSYQHELLHAGTYVELIAGRTPEWSGLVKLIKGTSVTDVNQSYYFRFSANDEILATALSIKLDAQILVQMKKSQTPKEFNDFHGKASDTLNEIYFSALAGISLSKQTQSLANSALKNLDKALIFEEALSLGRMKKNITVVEFKLNSYDRSSATSYQALAEGTSFKLYFTKRPNTVQIETKLRGMIRKSQTAQSLFTQVEKSIPVLIEYPQIDKADISKILNLSSGPFEALLPH